MNNTLLQEAIESLSIHEVTLNKSNLYVSDNFEPLFPLSESFGIQSRQGTTGTNTLKVNSSEEESRSFLRVGFECAFRLIPDELPKEALKDQTQMEEQVLAEVIAQFTAYYSIDKEVQEEAISEFCKYNVGYHVWPYWREYAASVANRLRLPPVILPLYKVPSS